MSQTIEISAFVTDDLEQYIKESNTKVTADQVEHVLSLLEEFQETDGDPSRRMERARFLTEGNTGDQSMRDFLTKHSVRVGSLTIKRWKAMCDVVAAINHFPWEEVQEILNNISNDLHFAADNLDIDFTEMRLSEIIEYMDKLSKAANEYERVADEEKDLQHIKPEELEEVAKKLDED